MELGAAMAVCRWPKLTLVNCTSRVTEYAGGSAVVLVHPSGISDELLLLRVEIALIPEAVAVSRARELVDENRLKRRPEHAAGDVVFANADHKQVRVIDAAVDILKVCRQRCVGRDLREAGDAIQAKEGPDRV